MGSQSKVCKVHRIEDCELLNQGVNIYLCVTCVGVSCQIIMYFLTNVGFHIEMMKGEEKVSQLTHALCIANGFATLP